MAWRLRKQVAVQLTFRLETAPRANEEGFNFEVAQTDI
jgi:hypothetical protein